MDQSASLRNRLTQINENNFEDIALGVFKFQSAENAVYARFLELKGIRPESIKSLRDIPFLPIRFFKNYEVKSGVWQSEKIFRSSGTSVTGFSYHHVRSQDFYLTHAIRNYENNFGALEDTCFLAILPSYTERNDASLAAMADCFIKRTRMPGSGFLHNDPQRLRSVIDAALSMGKSVMVLGVTFALLDLVIKGFDFTGVRIMETGGMKGRGRELIREELHRILSDSNPLEICSEYGMTELFSQAYARSGGSFRPGEMMRVQLREINDNRAVVEDGATGVLNIIDLANLDTCSFIETQDLGRKAGEAFEVLGRLDYSDLRGCSLMTL
ncbi:MAG: acyl transferase [Cyclobacteriaceae bacterium]